MSSTVSVYCDECGLSLDQTYLDDSSKKCPECESIMRHIDISIAESMVVRDGFKLQERPVERQPGERSVSREIIQKPSFHVESGGWRQVSMDIDRKNDRYGKTVTNPRTGEILYKKDEPLSKHQGRGKAKPGGA